MSKAAQLEAAQRQAAHEQWSNCVYMAQEVVRLRDAVTAIRKDVQAVFHSHHCLVCANGSPCNALILLSRIRARADDVLHPIASESYAEPDPAATLRDAG